MSSSSDESGNECATRNGDQIDVENKKPSDFSIEHILNHAGSSAGSSNERFNGQIFSENFEVLTGVGGVIAGNSGIVLPWLQCTRYCPPKVPRKREGSQKRQLGRHPRIPFTGQQLAILEDRFRQSPYLSSEEVTKLSAILQLADIRVKIWFQNRRARERRERQQPDRSPPETTSPSHLTRIVSPAPGTTPTGMTSPGMASRGITSQGTASHGMASHGVTLPGMTLSGMTLPGMTSHGVTSHGMASNGMTSLVMTLPGVTLPVTLPVTTSPGMTSPGRRSPGRRSPGRRSPLRRSPGRISPVRSPGRTISPVINTQTAPFDPHSLLVYQMHEFHPSYRQHTAQNSQRNNQNR